MDAQISTVRRLSALSYALTYGQITFEYYVPPLAHLHVHSAILSEAVDSFTQSYTLAGGSPHSASSISLYNWQHGSWDTITLTPSSPFTTQNISAYLGPNGRVLVRCVNHESNLGIIAFTRPALTLIGVASTT